MDRTVLTGSCGSTPVLAVYGINKKSGSLGLKNRFSSRFQIFTVRPPGLIQFWKPCSCLLDASQIMPRWMNSKSWFLLSWCSPNNAKMDSKRLLSWYFPNNSQRFLCFQLFLHPNWIEKTNAFQIMPRGFCAFNYFCMPIE